MTQAIKLPRRVEDLTAAWLSGAICGSSDAQVASAAVAEVMHGTGTKVLIDLCISGTSDARWPSTVCVKGDFDERLRATLPGSTASYTQPEAEFYRDVAPRLNLPLPQYWFADAEPGMGIVVLENLKAAKAEFGTPMQPWSAERVGKALDILARLHASTWDKVPQGLPWLRVGSSPTLRTCNEFLMSEQYWHEHFSLPDIFKLPAVLSNREQNLAAMRVMWKYDDERARCLIHGDAHVGNTYVDREGEPFFIDWACVSISHWAADVPYFVTGALSVPDRRALERDLLHHYLRRLFEYEGPRLDATDAWDDFRRHQVQGICWPLTPPTMQSPERVQAMGERFCTAIEDHDTFRLLLAD